MIDNDRNKLKKLMLDWVGIDYGEACRYLEYLKNDRIPGKSTYDELKEFESKKELFKMKISWISKWDTSVSFSDYLTNQVEGFVTKEFLCDLGDLYQWMWACFTTDPGYKMIG